MTGADAFLNDVPSDQELRALVVRAQRAFQWRAQADALTGTASVEGVTVTVNGGGSLTALRLEEEACRDGGRALADRIVAALGLAQETVSAQLLASARETFGEQAPELDTIGASLEERRAVTRAARGGEDEDQPDPR